MKERRQQWSVIVECLQKGYSETLGNLIGFSEYYSNLPLSMPDHLTLGLIDGWIPTICLMYVLPTMFLVHLLWYEPYSNLPTCIHYSRMKYWLSWKPSSENCSSCHLVATCAHSLWCDWALANKKNKSHEIAYLIWSLDGIMIHAHKSVLKLDHKQDASIYFGEGSCNWILNFSIGVLNYLSYHSSKKSYNEG